MANSIYDLIVSPLFTEKANYLSENSNKHTFIVRKSATKNDVKSAVESLFGVKISKVNILNSRGKVKRFKGTVGKRASKKISIITLADGHKIDYNNIAGN